VGYGVCDTPELWRGAAGLCARVRACAGAAESLHTYIHRYSYRYISILPPGTLLQREESEPLLYGEERLYICNLNTSMHI